MIDVEITEDNVVELLTKSKEDFQKLILQDNWEGSEDYTEMMDFGKKLKKIDRQRFEKLSFIEKINEREKIKPSDVKFRYIVTGADDNKIIEDWDMSDYIAIIYNIQKKLDYLFEKLELDDSDFVKSKYHKWSEEYE